jgi:amino acid permease
VDHPDESARHVYQAPTLLVAAFYVILLVWSVICISLIDAILEEGGTTGVFPLFMIGFILFYMWYFSLAISYRLELKDDGEIRLRSLRRTLRTNAKEISAVEFPRVGFGFIRFRLEREKAYLFCLPQNAVLKRVLEAIRSANSDIMFKRH